MKITAAVAVVDGFQAVKAAVESVYPCLGLVCADIGGLLVSGGTGFYAGMEPCQDYLAGYALGTNVWRTPGSIWISRSSERC